MLFQYIFVSYCFKLQVGVFPLFSAVFGISFERNYYFMEYLPEVISSTLKALYTML